MNRYSSKLSHTWPQFAIRYVKRVRPKPKVDFPSRKLPISYSLRSADTEKLSVSEPNKLPTLQLKLAYQDANNYFSDIWILKLRRWASLIIGNSLIWVFVFFANDLKLLPIQNFFLLSFYVSFTLFYLFFNQR